MEEDNNNYCILMIFSSLFILLYIRYLFLVIEYIIKNYHTKKLCVFWIDYCILIVIGILFIIIYIINLIILNFKDNKNDNNIRISIPLELSKDPFSILLIASLTTMCYTIINSLLFDAITAFQLSLKMNKIKKVVEMDLFAVSEKFKNININNILKMEYTYKYYIIFSIVNILLVGLMIFLYIDTDRDHFDSIFSLYNYFTYLLRYYHLIVLVLLIINIWYMNKSKKILLKKEYYNPNRITQKIYDVHFSQIVYFTDVISFKLVSDLIMNIPALLFLSLAHFNSFTLILSEFIIFLYIFLGGNDNLIIDKHSKAGKISKKMQFWFCFKKIDFHFGEKDKRFFFEEFKYNYSQEEQNVLNNLNMTILKNIENNSTDIDEDNNLNDSGYLDSFLELNSINNTNAKLGVSNKNPKYLDFKTVSEFYLIQKLIMLYFKSNKKVYESAMDNMDESCFAFKKLDRKKTKIININSQTKENFISNVNRASRLSTRDINKIKPSLKIAQTEVFTSIEEKELFEELKNKLKIKNDKYIYKIESLLSSELFELFPFYQMKINNIIKSLNPTRNINIFNKFVKRNNNILKSFTITNRNKHLSIKSMKSNISNDENDDIFINKQENKKEIEKNLYYTYDLYLMYEIYDKKDFVSLEELNRIISEYNKYLLSVVKNMNYTFLPLILGIFSLEIYDSNKIIIVYRNPLYFSNFSHFNHWINFYITEEPEKIRVSSLFNDVIDVNEIEIRNSLELNEIDYDEVKKNLENDYSFLKKIKNIYPIIHLFIGDENNEDEAGQINEDGELKNSTKKNQNIYMENSILGDLSVNNDICIFDVLNRNFSISNIQNEDEYNEINNIINENSLFDKEYYNMSGNIIRTVKIYFTNLFRRDYELNQGSGNFLFKINSDSYCDYLQEQLIKYLTRKSLFNDEEKKKDDDDNENEDF